jgi:hypothetical protein
MKISKPVWSLTQDCPKCQQGESLVFVACPNCHYVAVECDQDCGVFLQPHNLDVTKIVSPDNETNKLLCPSCGKAHIFETASDVEIHSNGWQPKDMC